MRGKSIVLSILVLFLFSAAVFAGEEGEQENSKTTLRTLTVDAAEGLYDGTSFVLREGVCDPTRAAYDGGKWFVNQTPADHGRRGGRFFQWSRDELVKTPGRLWRATRWGLGHVW